MRATHRNISRSNEHIHFELLDCPECVYLSDNGKCRNCIGEKACIGFACTFRTSAKSETERALTWKQRLNTLPDEQQEKIAKKYYGGKMPWRN